MIQCPEDEPNWVGFDEILSDIPTFDRSDVEQCLAERDASALLFEWYKFVATKCVLVGGIDLSASQLRPVPPVHQAVLIGLLNRCARLMISNVRLSCDGAYGESTKILDRCILESATKIRWLCLKDDRECFVRYLADGLKNDFLLQDTIWRNVTERAGDVLIIEKRMIGSIERCLQKSGLAAADVHEAKPLPDLASMFRDLEFDDIHYLVLQRMGSHSVHGTWTDLVHHYLEQDEAGVFSAQDLGIATHEVQFVVVSQLVLCAIADYLHYIVEDHSLLTGFVSQVHLIEAELIKLGAMGRDSDFDVS